MSKMNRGFFSSSINSGCTVLYAGEEKRKTSEEKSKENLAEVLVVDAVTYIQRDTPNLNFVRFSESSLAEVAASGKGTPFLKDHNQTELDARGGTVIESFATKVNGETVFKQKIKVTEDWAKRGVLAGTIDRFSIGWRSTGRVSYLHNGEEVTQENTLWPGQELEDGSVVEWVFESAELIEVSAVNVPAVSGTSINQVNEFRASLSSALGWEMPSNNTGAKQRTRKHMNKVLQKLGLDDAASEEKAVQELEGIQSKITTLQAELDATKAQLLGSNEELAKLQSLEADRAKQAFELEVQGLYACGKLVKTPEGEPDAEEAHIRNLHSHGGAELFNDHVKLMRVKAPITEATQSEGTEVEGEAVEASRVVRLRNCGISQERFGELNRKHQNKILEKWGRK